MRLTQRQRRMISAFLRQVDPAQDGVPASVRAQRLADAKSRVWKELKRVGKNAPDDDDVAAALRRCPDLAGNGQEREVEAERHEGKAGPPEPVPDKKAEVAEPLPEVKAEAPELRTGLAAESRAWLGVCTALSERIRTDPFRVRLAFVLLGVVTGPLALIVYLGIYFELYASSRKRGAPPIEWTRLFTSLFATMAAAAAFYGGTRGLFALAASLFERFTAGPLVLGPTGWLDAYHNILLTGVLFLSLPIAALSALPLPDQWDRTGKRVAQAVFAVYAVVLSLGIASAAVGIILHVVEEVVS